MTAGADGERRAAPRGTGLVVGLALLASAAASVGFIVALVAGDHVQAEGVALAVGTAGLAVAMAIWARWFMPQGPETEDRPVLESSADQRAAVVAELDQGERTVIGRRTLLGLLAAAVGALAAAAVVPLRSLGPPILDDLRRTAWRSGARLVDESGAPIQLADVDTGSFRTVYPEGVAEDQKADTETVLLRIEPGTLATGPAAAGAVDGCVAFSKVCTHAGCPVGLFQVETNQLVCPCHQSVFDVVAGAEPTAGPASRPLPQLPLGVDGGFLVATGDFPTPVGPAFWSMDRP